MGPRCFADVLYFFAVAAAQGVAGNLAYGALCRLVRAIRKPKQEIGSRELRFETVVSRKTYNRLRREEHPLAKACREPASITSKLETKYKLMVTLRSSKSSAKGGSGILGLTVIRDRR